MTKSIFFCILYYGNIIFIMFPFYLHCKNLTELSLCNDTYATDDDIKNLPLVDLSLQGNFKITNRALKYLTGLTSLNLAYNSTITDEGITHLTSLTSLNLTGQRTITDDAITKLTNLTYLNLNMNVTITPDALKQLPHLKLVEAKYNQPVFKRYFDSKNNHYEIKLAV